MKLLSGCDILKTQEIQNNTWVCKLNLEEI